MKKFKVTSSVINNNAVRVDYIVADNSVTAIKNLMKLYPLKREIKSIVLV
jgi:hypothetical protein